MVVVTGAPNLFEPCAHRLDQRRRAAVRHWTQHSDADIIISPVDHGDFKAASVGGQWLSESAVSEPSTRVAIEIFANKSWYRRARPRRCFLPIPSKV